MRRATKSSVKKSWKTIKTATKAPFKVGAFVADVIILKLFCTELFVAGLKLL
jgi:hypothetical protein